tara:strand:- start:341 stop:646 length:306 start_codon:yes stop_codon:yes gene_type:complete
MKNAITVEQLKESVKADYLKALEGRTDGEALMLFLEELATMFAANTSLMSQIEDLKKEIEALKKENEARKKESVAIGEEQQKIHKWYKKQFSKSNGWRWWT